MATAREKNGKWYYRITLTVGDGTHKYIERGSWKTKREALDAGKKAEVKIKDGEDIGRVKIMLFHFLAEEWLKSSESTYKDTTIEDYQKELKLHILPYLGDYQIKAITSKQLQAVIDKGAAMRTRHSLSKTKACMSQCFKYAMRNGYLKENPMVNVYLPEPRSKVSAQMKPKREIRILDKDEIAAIFKRFPEGHTDYIPLLLGYRCGLRIGEAFGVSIDDIDFKNKTLNIRRQIQYNDRNQLYFTEPKYCLPGEGRVIDLDSNTLMILKRHVDKLLRLMIPCNFKTYYMDSDGYLNEESGTRIDLLNVRLIDGSFISPRTMMHVGRVIHGKEGQFDCVDPLWDFHAMRHTHASECFSAGMSVVSVQHRLGHKNLATTMKYYIHETSTQRTETRDIINTMYDN